MHNFAVERDSNIEAKPPRILVGICSCLAYPEKRQAVRNTWLTKPSPGIECRFFVGGGGILEDEPDTVVLDCDDSYDFLPSKVLDFFKHSLESSDFEWLFKCDDDTYLVLDRLHTIVDPDYEMVGNEHLTNRGSPSGGAGYLLSRRVVEAIVADRSLSRTGPEDIVIGLAATKHGAAHLATDRLRWNAIPFPRSSNFLITAHWCSPERLMAIHTILHSKPSKKFQGIHLHWVDELHFYDNGVFCRESSGCCGIWRLDADDHMVLRWFDWGEETLPSEGSIYRNRNLRLVELGDPRFEPSVQAITAVPWLDLTLPPQPLKMLYFCPVGSQCLHLVESVVRVFQNAGADIKLVAYGDKAVSHPRLDIEGPVIGGKWQLAKSFLKPEEVADYDYLFVWDDDVAIQSFKPAEFATIMRLNRLEMAQPSIVSTHWISHPITCPSRLPESSLPEHQIVGRLTNFVEVMVPVFSREAWKFFHPFISETNRTGWGYDYFPFTRRGIVDTMPIEHTRAVGSMGAESGSELSVFMGQHGLLQYAPAALGYLFGSKQPDQRSTEAASSRA